MEPIRMLVGEIGNPRPGARPAYAYCRYDRTVASTGTGDDVATLLAGSAIAVGTPIEDSPLLPGGGVARLRQRLVRWGDFFESWEEDPDGIARLRQDLSFAGICDATAFAFGGGGDARTCWHVIGSGEALTEDDLVGDDRRACNMG